MLFTPKVDARGKESEIIYKQGDADKLCNVICH